jgi:16S rRNA (cytosine1402-N4)-methyltransferase
MAACRMSTEVGKHLPVLFNEVIENLAIQADGIYVDATFGRGGHAEAILKQLSPVGRLVVIDKDPQAIAYARQRFQHETRVIIRHGSFADLETIVKDLNWQGKITGILIDLGVSSPQLDEPDRGFSFMRDGKLDMRMDSSQGVDAAEWIAKIDEQALIKVLFEYGEEKYARRIARFIMEARAEAPITTTAKLAEIVSAAIPKWQIGKHPATRSFLAIRIAVNRELEDLEQVLAQSLEVLAIGGRLAVISFHSLEDRLVKRFIQHHERGGDFPPGLPIRQDCFRPRLKRLGRAIKPSQEEVAFNSRARSAILRITEKLL